MTVLNLIFVGSRERGTHPTDTSNTKGSLLEGNWCHYPGTGKRQSEKDQGIITRKVEGLFGECDLRTDSVGLNSGYSFG